MRDDECSLSSIFSEADFLQTPHELESGIVSGNDPIYTEVVHKMNELSPVPAALSSILQTILNGPLL